MDGENDKTKQFIAQVQRLYLDNFGDDIAEENGEPFTLGTTLVSMEANHVDGGSTTIFLYDGSLLVALGLLSRAKRFLGDD